MFRRALLPVLLCLVQTVAAQAEPTEIVVRVTARDAKFIGTDMGGAQVILRDADTGEILAQGLTSGTTGSTPRIMSEGRLRRDPVSDAMSAKFAATLELAQPRRITAVVTGPMKPASAATTVSSTQWVLPGKSINAGDGWLIEIPGFAVSVLEPPIKVDLARGPQKITLLTKVTLMCGCPITPGGQWDADKLQLGISVERAGKAIAAASPVYAGRASEFTGEIQISEPGQYQVTVWAYDPTTGNSGLDRIAIGAN